MLVMIALFVLMIVLALVVIGSVERLRVIELAKLTSASRERIWRQWAEIANRPVWDVALESVSIDGPFQVGTAGVATLKDRAQPVRFMVTELQPYQSTTERFFLPFFNRMDWQRSIQDAGDGRREVTFRVEVKGPGALFLKPILGRRLRRELPATVEKFVAAAEASR